jgi:hypothetical protein
MLWFRHSHDLRNSPAMKQIQRRLGDEGFAAAIRLIEVMTYRSGKGETFNPTLTLAPPTTLRWLAAEILTHVPDDDEEYAPEQRVIEFLNEFSEAGLIRMGEVDGTKNVATKDGWETLPCKFYTVQLTEFEEMMDVWTARVARGKTGKE